MLRLLSQADVCARLGDIDPSTLWSWYKSGHFPAPIVLGPGDGIRTALRWREDEVDAFIESRPRRGDPPPIMADHLDDIEYIRHLMLQLVEGDVTEAARASYRTTLEG